MNAIELNEQFLKVQESEKFKELTDIQQIAFKLGWLECAIFVAKKESEN